MKVINKIHININTIKCCCLKKTNKKKTILALYIMHIQKRNARVKCSDGEICTEGVSAK